MQYIVYGCKELLVKPKPLKKLTYEGLHSLTSTPCENIFCSLGTSCDDSHKVYLPWLSAFKGVAASA